MNFESNWLNVVLLATCQALGVSVTAIVIFVASLIAVDLLANPAWATLPNANMVIGTALFAVPITLSMQRFGRRYIICAAMCLAALACLLIIYALSIQSFVLFATAVTGIGISVAAIGQFRFWAMESVSLEKKTTAAATVLLGGVFAAFLGPELALYGENIFAIRFQGTFAIATGLLLTTGFIALFVKEIPLPDHNHAEPQRPLKQMLTSRWLWSATLAATVGYAVMTLIMTATPISMHHHFGHSLDDTKWVIQSHIVAMFLPSLIMPIISRLLGLQRMIVIGAILFAICIGMGLMGSSLNNFWLALVLLGVGWNLLFVSGTSLLPQTHLPRERFRAQAFNDGFIYTAQAMASLGSGVLLSWLNWQWLLIFCLPLVLVPVVALVAARRQTTSPPMLSLAPE